MSHAGCEAGLQSTASYESIKGRKHTWRGSRSVAQLKRAAALQLEYTTKKVDVKLRSQTGHILPGGTLRIILLEVVLLASDGTERQRQQISISAENENRLLPDENRTYTFNTISAATSDTIRAALNISINTRNTGIQTDIDGRENACYPLIGEDGLRVHIRL